MKHRSPRRTITGLVTALTVVFCATSCSQKNIRPWSPKPLVLWEDICAQPIPLTTNTFRIIKREQTRGLFPASMAVTRIGIDSEQNSDPGVRVRLVTDPRNEFLQWNTALDDQMAISEVFPIRDEDLGGRRITMDLLFDASVALDAQLGLIYAVNELHQDRTEILGVIYDLTSTQPLAAIHSEATSIEPHETAGMDAPSLWKTDSRALARAQFDRLLHSCIRELIIQDQPPPVVVPAGWPSSYRSQPAVWPPTRPQSRP